MITENRLISKNKLKNQRSFTIKLNLDGPLKQDKLYLGTFTLKFKIENP